MGLLDQIIKFLGSKRSNREELCKTTTEELQKRIHALEKYATEVYVYSYTQKDIEDDARQYVDSLLQIRKQIKHTKGYPAFKKAYQEYKNAYRSYRRRIKPNNQRILQACVTDAQKRLGKVEGKTLDEQQLQAIVKNPTNHLVIAGAGTGKTTTLVAKVKYLLTVCHVHPKRILVISFTNATVEEMKSRILSETGKEIRVTTFHQLGLSVVRNVEHRKQNVYEDFAGTFIPKTLKKLVKDPSYARILIPYIFYYQLESKEEGEFDSKESYLNYLSAHPPVSMKGEKMKSYGEVRIANFLFEHGIEYQYEAYYEYPTRDADHRQYQPDFYLPGTRVYIEYFALSRENQVPAYFTGKNGQTGQETYLASINRKRHIHQEYGTTMIECYAYENLEGTLLKNLEQHLRKQHVSFKAVDLDSLIETCTNSRALQNVGHLLSTLLILTKNQRLDATGIRSLARRDGSKASKYLAELLIPIQTVYEDMLKKENLIDFPDMLNRATDAFRSKQFNHNYSYVLVDEYQDMTHAQYELLKAMHENYTYRLFAVGDDWQSIYRFAGSDIGLMLQFDSYWKQTEISKIETTYRFPNSIVNISSQFILQNPSQLRKQVKTTNPDPALAVSILKGDSDLTCIQQMRKEIEHLPFGSTVLLLGRYTFDQDLLELDPVFRLVNDVALRKMIVEDTNRKDLDISFYTIHRSKGLEADYVYVLNNHSTGSAFPEQHQNPAFLNALLQDADTYPHGEERRLFYVALTRARKHVTFLSVTGDTSEFVQELTTEDLNPKPNRNEFKRICPLCGGRLIRVKGRYGYFYGCKNYKITGCSYKEKLK